MCGRLLCSPLAGIWQVVAKCGILWRMPRTPDLHAIKGAVDAFERQGAGFWQLKAIDLAALDALPSVLAAMKAAGVSARPAAIEDALRDACLALPGRWRETALAQLGFSEEAETVKAMTERRKLAAKKLIVNDRAYRRTEKDAEQNLIPWLDGRFTSYIDKTNTLVAEQLLYSEFGVDVRSWAPAVVDSDDPYPQEDGVGLAFAGVRDHHIELFRVTEDGRVEHRWHPDEDDAWSAWHDFGFRHTARDVAAASAWSGHLEVFILATDGTVWHRIWWEDKEWNEFDFLGRPFQTRSARAIAAASKRDGHLDVQVVAVDGTLRNNWFDGTRWAVAKDEPQWNEMGG